MNRNMIWLSKYAIQHNKTQQLIEITNMIYQDDYFKVIV